MRALITNDDGIDSIGLHTLARVAVQAGLDVTVVAPDTERSGSSAALSAVEKDGRLLLTRSNLPDLREATAYAAHASPALIVFVAVRGAFGDPPDIVLSGINRGPNVGQAVMHSGTVGAALTAQSQGLPGLALSFAAANSPNWESAAEMAHRALDMFLPLATSPIVLNVNVPDVPRTQLRGLRVAELANFGAVQAKIGKRGHGYVVTTFEEIDTEPQPDTDVALLRKGWTTVTALDGPCTSQTHHNIKIT